MKLHIRLISLFLSMLLLACFAPSAGAAAQPSPGRVYRGQNDSLYEVHLNREIDFSVITRRYASVDLYWGEGAEEYDAFTIVWDEAAFQSHVEAGETEFELTGAYGLSEESSQELTELWEAGLVTMPDAPRLLVHIRPRDYVTVYSVLDEESVWTVQSGTSFDEAVRGKDTVTLLPSGENPYGDPTEVDFVVTWNQADYEAGTAGGGETFTISGIYGEPEQDALRGWVRAVGTATATVVVTQTPDQPELYRDYYFEMSGENTPYVTHVTPQCAFETLLLPEERQLYPVGTTPFDQKGRDFSICWDRTTYEAGLASGQDIFTLYGSYGPGADWTAEETTLWEDGLIQIAPDVPVPELDIHVIREEAYPFTVQVVYRGSDYMPQFRFPWVNGTEALVCAISFDKKTWYEQTAYAEDSNRWDPEVEFPGIWSGWYYDDGEEITIPANGVFYAKVIPTGSVLLGESDIYELKPTGEDGTWEMILDDGGTGDHGGGGQGEHDRPGKEEPDVPLPDSETGPTLDQDPEQPQPVIPPPDLPSPPTPDLEDYGGGQGEHSHPGTEEPDAPLPGFETGSEPDQILNESLEPVQQAIPPSPSQSTPSPEEPPVPPAVSELPTAAYSPADPDSQASSGQPAPSTGEAEANSNGAQLPPSTDAPSVEPDTEPVLSENDIPASDDKMSPHYIPGFVTAVVATIGLILGGTVWFHLHGKRK